MCILKALDQEQVDLKNNKQMKTEIFQSNKDRMRNRFQNTGIVSLNLTNQNDVMQGAEINDFSIEPAGSTVESSMVQLPP